MDDIGLQPASDDTSVQKPASDDESDRTLASDDDSDWKPSSDDDSDWEAVSDDDSGWKSVSDRKSDWEAVTDNGCSSSDSQCQSQIKSSNSSELQSFSVPDSRSSTDLVGYIVDMELILLT